jgi:hypothetical protein
MRAGTLSMLRHYEAFKAQIAADSSLKVHDAARTDGKGGLLREQYVIAIGGPPEELDDGRLASPQGQLSDAVFSYTARAVSISASGAMLVAARVFAQVVGAVLQIDGRTCLPIELDGADEKVQVDNNVNPPMFYLDQDFTLRSSRA